MELSDKLKKQVENATVKIIRRGGQGVVVRGGLILTAAHCVEFTCVGYMALGDYYIEEIETSSGILKAAPLAVEPVKDIAVLGPPDEQAFCEEAEAYEEWHKNIEPIPLCFRQYERFQKLDAYIFTHEGTWIKGKATHCGEDKSAFVFDSIDPVKGGTSGGPIVNEYGELLGVVSTGSETPIAMSKEELGEYNDFHPRASIALPVWVIRRINADEEEPE